MIVSKNRIHVLNEAIYYVVMFVATNKFTVGKGLILNLNMIYNKIK